MALEKGIGIYLYIAFLFLSLSFSLFNTVLSSLFTLFAHPRQHKSSVLQCFVKLIVLLSKSQIIVYTPHFLFYLFSLCLYVCVCVGVCVCVCLKFYCMFCRAPPRPAFDCVTLPFSIPTEFRENHLQLGICFVFLFE